MKWVALHVDQQHGTALQPMIDVCWQTLLHTSTCGSDAMSNTVQPRWPRAQRSSAVKIVRRRAAGVLINTPSQNHMPMRRGRYCIITYVTCSMFRQLGNVDTITSSACDDSSTVVQTTVMQWGWCVGGSCAVTRSLMQCDGSRQEKTA